MPGVDPTERPRTSAPWTLGDTIAVTVWLLLVGSAVAAVVHRILS